MSSLLQKLFYRIIISDKKRSSQKKELSAYVLAKNLKLFRRNLQNNSKNFLFIVTGIFSATFGLKSFLLPNMFIDGGVTGISLLVSQFSGIHLSYLLIFVNLPFILLGITQINKSFAIKTLLAIIGLAVCVGFINFPVMTSDKLLIAIFGGFFLGAGIGLAVRGGAVLDGTEILAIFINRKINITIGDVILIINILIFSVASYLLSIETVLYSILTYLAASRTVNFFVEGIDEYIGISVISAKYDDIRLMIVEKLGRGVTVYKGQKGFGKRGDYRADVDIIFTVITRLEMTRLRSEVEKIDPNAFIVINSIIDTKGGLIKKRPLSKI